MKSIYKILPVFLAAMPFFTACEDDLDVGTPLFPVEEEFNGPKVYINEKGVPANSRTETIVQTPMEIIIDEKVDSFYIYSNLPVGEDITVSVKEDPQAGAAFDKDHPVLGEGVLNLITQTVVIPKGQKMSSTPIKYAIQYSDELKSFDETAFVALSISEVKGYAQAGKNNNAFYLYINKKKKNLKDDADFSDDKMIPADSYIITDQNGNENRYGIPLVDILGDSSEYTYFQGPKGCSLTFNFGQKRDFIGFVFAYGGNFDYMPKEVEILTSNDGEEFVSQGFCYPEYPATYKEVGNGEFYSPISCQYVKLLFVHSWYYWSPYYDKPAVCEVRMFEK